MFLGDPHKVSQKMRCESQSLGCRQGHVGVEVEERIVRDLGSAIGCIVKVAFEQRVLILPSVEKLMSDCVRIKIDILCRSVTSNVRSMCINCQNRYIRMIACCGAHRVPLSLSTRVGLYDLIKGC
jgi:hypothetical protein